MSHVYRNPRPILTIERGSERALGRCYSGTTYTVTSLQPLVMTDFKALRSTALLGYGQEFTVHQVGPAGDGTTIPVSQMVVVHQDLVATGFDDVPCIEINPAGNPTIAINPRTQAPFKPMRVPYYVYECEDRVDSS